MVVKCCLHQLQSCHSCRWQRNASEKLRRLFLPCGSGFTPLCGVSCGAKLPLVGCEARTPVGVFVAAGSLCAGSRLAKIPAIASVSSVLITRCAAAIEDRFDPTSLLTAIPLYGRAL